MLCKRYILVLVLMIISLCPTLAQKQVKAVLINRADNQALPYAIVKELQSNKIELSDSAGRFSFVVPDTTTQLQLEIGGLGFHVSLIHKLGKKGIEKVYVDKQAFYIPGVEITGLSAKQVVAKAIAEIPNLYTDAGYFANSFYRQYHKENGKFVRLIEVQGITMFNITPGRRQLNCVEALAITNMRRAYDYEQNRLEHSDHFFDLLIENPIYHPLGSPLNGKAQDVYIFKFDTTYASGGDYIIAYHSTDYSKESIASGRLFIDPISFAIKRIERTNTKNNNRDYRQVLSDKYVSDFISGTAVTEYAFENGKWYLKKMLREYTTEIYFRPTNNKFNTTTECFEWYSDSTTNRVAHQYRDAFDHDSHLYATKYTYNPGAWLVPLHPFVYFKQEDVYKSISQKVPIEEQFEKAGN